MPELTILRALQNAIIPKAAPQGLRSPSSGWGGGWWPLIREPFTGAWQRNQELRRESVLTYSAVYACVTLIASDIAKIRLRLVEQVDGIWSETEVSAFSPVLRKPNRYQTRIKFVEQWIVSKLLHGNTYVLKERDGRGVVVAMYVLDPTRVKALVAPDGAVYYQLSKDNIAGLEGDILVPASEIIHDTMVPLYHPLCGVSPLTACGLAAMQGLNIQKNSATFFENGSQPSGVLTAPGPITDPTAARAKKYWEDNFTQGKGVGRVAVLGDGLKYEQMTMSAVDAQLIDQLKWSAETVCSCFHVPPYMIGVGAMPSYNNVEALNQQYYTQCLQSPIESVELCLDEGLGLVDVQGKKYGTEFDLEDLLRMDTATKVKTAAEGLKGIFTPNEARKKFDLKAVPGGDTVYLQQQNFSLAALDRRDSSDDPFSSAKPAPKMADVDESADGRGDNDNSQEELAAAATVAGWAMKSFFQTHAAQ